LDQAGGQWEVNVVHPHAALEITAASGGLARRGDDTTTRRRLRR